MGEEDELLTLIEASKESEYSPEALRLWASKGHMKAKKYGRQWLVERRELRRFLAGHHPTTGRPRGSRKPSP